MLNIDYIRENKELVQEGADKKGVDVDIGELLEVDEKRKELKQKVDELRENRNLISEKVKKCDGDEERQELIERGREVKEELAEVEDKFKAVKERWKKLMLQVPNVPASDVPKGEGEKQNEVLRREGEKPDFDFEPKDHLQLGEELGIIDFESGAKVSGSNFYYLKNKGALLARALINFGLDKVREEGFEVMMVPNLVKKDAMEGTGFFPAEEREVYELEKDGLYLIGTSEVPLGAYKKGETVDSDELPLHFSGFSPCYRREAGSYGKEAKGLYRTHQFNKVEAFLLCRPGKGEEKLEQLTDIAEEVVSGLGLPYRFVKNCTGDLGFPQIKKFDLETWMPGRGIYGETHSCSYDGDFQARRLQMKFENKEGEKKYLHTLNGTVVTDSRLLVALLENYQTKDGDVVVPEALRPYCGFEKINQGQNGD